MSVGLTIYVKEDATIRLKRIGAMIDPSDCMLVAGHAVANLIRKHLRELEANHQQTEGWWKRLSPGRWPSTHWYEGAARSVTAPVALNRNMVSIGIGQVGFGLQLKGSQAWLGRPVVPVEKRWLTIPARPEAYGRRAPEMQGLRFTWYNTGTARVPVLMTGKEGAYREHYEKGGKVKVRRFTKSVETVMYWLVKKANITAHPENLPKSAQFIDTIKQHVRAYVNRLWRRKQTP